MRKSIKSFDPTEVKATIIIVLLLILLLFFVGPGWSQCTATISACETITASGTYCINNNTAFQAAGDCLNVTAPNVTIVPNIQNQADSAISFQGNGTGAAIHATSAATGFTYVGGDGDSISSFATGIQDDASSAVMEIGAITMTAVNTGYWLNHVSGSVILAATNGTVTANGIAVYVQGGGSNYVFGNFADPLPADQGPTMSGGAAGVMIEGSLHNLVFNMNATGSANAGIVVRTGSKNNLIYNNTAQGPLGIRVKWDSPNNWLINNTASGTQFDLFQGTNPPSSTSCNGNFWLDNHDGAGAPGPSVNQDCVQNPLGG